MISMRRLGLVALVVAVGALVWQFARHGEAGRARAARRAPAPVAEPAARPPAAPEVPAAPAEPGIPHRFLVLSAVDEQPLAGVRVTLEPGGESGATAGDGTLELAGRPDTERYVARLEGYVPGSGFPGDFERVLLEPGLVVAGRVVRLPGEAPFPGAAVRAWDMDAVEQLGGTETTDAEGRFALAGVRPHQPFRVVALAPGYAPAIVERAVAAPGTGLVLRLGGGGTLEGRVVHADGRPAAGAELYVVPPARPPPPWHQAGVRYVGDEAELAKASAPHAITDAEGAFSLRGLPLDTERRLAVTVSRLFHAWSEPFRFVRDGEVVRIEVVLPAPASLRVFAQDAKGEPMPKFQADLGDDLFLFVRHGNEGEPDGSRFFDAVAPGTYLLRVWPRSGAFIDREIELRPGEDAVQVVTPEEGIVLEGSVVDAAGRPVTAEVTWSGRKGARVQTDARGRFRIPGLAAEPGLLGVAPHGEYAVQEREGVVPGARRVRVVVAADGVVTGRIVGIAPGTQVTVTYHSVGEVNGDAFDLPEDGRIRVRAKFLHEPFALHVEIAGFAPVVREGPGLDAGETRDLGDLQPDAGRTAQARVVDDAGRPVAGARVQVAELWASELVTRTDGEGWFRFGKMPPKTLRLRIDAEGFPPHLLELADGEATLALGRGGVVAGRADLGGAYVSLRPTDRPGFDPDRAAQDVQCAADGTFRCALQPGAYVAQLWDQATNEVYKTAFTVRAGETTAIELR